MEFGWCAVTDVVFVSAFRYIVTVKRRNKTFFFAVYFEAAERGVEIYSQTCGRARASRRLVKVFHNFVSFSLLHNHTLQVERRLWRAASRAE